MPELPEAETIARQLHAAIVGEALRDIRLARHDILRNAGPAEIRALKGRRVRHVQRRGKRVVIELDGDARLIFALGMTGQLTVTERSAPCPMHTHLRIRLGHTPREIRFRDPRRFGGVWLLNGRDSGDGDQRDRTPLPTGVEPLEVDLRAFRALLQRRRQIKALLLDQDVIAGMGNIYADEALHRAGIHPLTPAGDLDAKQSAALLRAIRHVLRAAINHRGTTLLDYRTADGQLGDYRKHHRVYQRTGLPCKRCGSPIEHILVCARSTHFCPSCQPALRPNRGRST